MMINLGNGLLCGDGDMPPPMGVVLKTLPATFEFSIPRLDHAVWRGILPYIYLGVKPLKPR